MRHTLSIFAATLIGMAASSAFAADDVLRLENVQGRIAVQMPVGFLPAEDGMAVHTGQKIIIRPKSSAMISYADGTCFVNLRKPGVFVVPALETCTPGQVSVFDGSFRVIPVNGEAGPGMAGGSLEPEIVAGAFVAATFGAALWTTFAEDSSPVTSP